MKDVIYKAYLSYSHQDERWARWLHGALERYRVPRHLASTTRESLPRRLAPVFRDRDDLSTAADLSDRLEAALRQSDHLIVVCSPAAVESRWVNEEIRRFRALGRGDRILCMVVDGDAAAPPEAGGCFPPALNEGLEEGRREPLAADPRDSGDGKRLARLKIAAALLGVRLDELRRRDLQRRRRVQAMAAALVIAVATLAGVTITAKISERQERAQAEQLAAFIVDLGDELRDQLDLETLGRISGRAMSYHDQLDARRLAPGTGVKVARALLQFGEINLLQGKFDDAGDAYGRALGILEILHERAPDDGEVAFELAQAEFYVGVFHFEIGEVDEARRHLLAYRDIAEAFHARMPDDPDWSLERAYAHSSLVNLSLANRESVDQRTLDAMQRNLDYAVEAMEARPGDAEAVLHYGNELAFLADAQFGSCRLEAARASRESALAIARQQADADPTSRELFESVAYRHSGLANVHYALGNLAEASRHRRAAIDRLNDLHERDPSNALVAVMLASNQHRLATQRMSAGDLEAAGRLFEQARTLLAPVMERQQGRDWRTQEYVGLVLQEAELALARGEPERADALLNASAELILDRESGASPSPGTVRARIHYRYLRWRLDGVDPATRDARLVEAIPTGGGPLRHCYDAFALATHAAMTGDRDAIETQAAYLDAAGFRDPSFLAFCRREALCGD